MPRLRTRIAPLDEGKRRDARDNRQRDEAGAYDPVEPVPLAPRTDPLAPELVLGLPRQDRRAEDIVEDLVARRRSLHAVDAADYPLAAKLLEQAPQLGVLDV